MHSRQLGEAARCHSEFRTLSVTSLEEYQPYSGQWALRLLPSRALSSRWRGQFISEGRKVNTLTFRKSPFG